MGTNTRNAPDATARNVRASHTRDRALLRRVQQLERAVAAQRGQIRQLATHAQILETRINGLNLTPAVLP